MNLTTVLCTLLKILSSWREDEVLRVNGRTPSGIDSGISLVLPGRCLKIDALPQGLQPTLDKEVWSLRIGLVGQPPRYLGAVMATWATPRVYRNPAPGMRDSRHGRQFILDPDLIRAAEDAMAGFPLAPTFVIAGGSPNAAGHTLTAIYALRQLIDVRGVGEASALELLRRLATALNAEPLAADVRLADLTIPLPGSLLREGNASGKLRSVVEALTCEPSRAYTLEELDAALTAPREAEPAGARRGATVR